VVIAVSATGAGFASKSDEPAIPSGRPPRSQQGWTEPNLGGPTPRVEQPLDEGLTPMRAPVDIVRHPNNQGKLHQLITQGPRFGRCQASSGKSRPTVPRPASTRRRPRPASKQAQSKSTRTWTTARVREHSDSPIVTFTATHGPCPVTPSTLPHETGIQRLRSRCINRQNVSTEQNRFLAISGTDPAEPHNLTQPTAGTVDDITNK
jgi:hypothetical protein